MAFLRSIAVSTALSQLANCRGAALASWAGDPANAARDWRILLSPLGHNTIQPTYSVRRWPPIITGGHRRPPAAASELSSGGYITLILGLCSGSVYFPPSTTLPPNSMDVLAAHPELAPNVQVLSNTLDSQSRVQALEHQLLQRRKYWKGPVPNVNVDLTNAGPLVLTHVERRYNAEGSQENWCVVDARLKVQNVRFVDVGILINTPLQPTIYAIAEKAVDMINGYDQGGVEAVGI
ncbi:hypothetical protein FB451DRAFT_1191626 [Mycena latifolia]|nr:hypothetical protein FB451DRAFT_1191626 [Mycena latifolia]